MPEKYSRILHRQPNDNYLLVLERHSRDFTSVPEDLRPMVKAFNDVICDRAVSAFGKKEADCMALAGIAA